MKEEEKSFKVFLSEIYGYKEKTVKELFIAKEAKAQKIVNFTTNHIRDVPLSCISRKENLLSRCYSMNSPSSTYFKFNGFNSVKKGNLTKCFNCQLCFVKMWTLIQMYKVSRGSPK